VKSHKAAQWNDGKTESAETTVGMDGPLRTTWGTRNAGAAISQNKRLRSGTRKKDDVCSDNSPEQVR
jgi:hypothetical protein